MSYRVILSLDGGATRGIVPLRILHELHEKVLTINHTFNLTRWVDVFGASSTSSIIAGALMLMDEKNQPYYTPKDLLKIYEKFGSRMFAVSNEENEVPLLHELLEHFFGQIKIQAINKQFVFSAYNATTQQPHLFNDGQSRLWPMNLSKLMLACSASQPHFEPVSIDGMLIHDGFMHIQNPSKLCYDYIKMHYPDSPIILISIGTGQNSNESTCKVHEEMEALKKESDALLYYRLDPKLKNVSMDFNDNSQINMKRILHEIDDYIEQESSKFDSILNHLAIKVKDF